MDGEDSAQIHVDGKPTRNMPQIIEDAKRTRNSSRSFDLAISRTIDLVEIMFGFPIYSPCEQTTSSQEENGEAEAQHEFQRQRSRHEND